MELDPNGLEILDRDECLRLLRSQVLGRIGVTVDAHPVVLPVNYCLFDGQLVIQTGQGRVWPPAPTGQWSRSKSTTWMLTGTVGASH